MTLPFSVKLKVPSELEEEVFEQKVSVNLVLAGGRQLNKHVLANFVIIKKSILVHLDPHGKELTYLRS